MVILVTGAAGFLGGRLVEKLVMLGHHVKAIGRCPIPEQFESMKNLVWIEKDIAVDGIESDEVASVDIVFHLAGRTLGAEKDEWRYLLANEATTVRLLQACAKHVKKFIFASSQVVYGDAHHTSVSEDFPLQGFNSAYACSKINSENWLRFFHGKYGGLYVVLRFSGFVEGGGVIDYMIDCALQNKPIELLSRGAVHRDYLPVEKGIEALTSVLNYEWSEGFVSFNIGSGQAVTSHELAKSILLKVNSSSEIILLDRQAPQRDFVFDVKKAAQCLKFNSGDLLESVRHYAGQKKVAFERNEGSAKN